MNVQTKGQRRAGLRRYQPVETLLTAFQKPVASENGPTLSEDTIAVDAAVPIFRPSGSPEKSNDTYIPKFSRTDHGNEASTAIKQPLNTSVPRFKPTTNDGHSPITRKDDVGLSTEVPKLNGQPRSTAGDSNAPNSSERGSTSSGNGKDNAKSKRYVNVDDPPISSDDDDENSLSKSGDIQPTIFLDQQTRKSILSAVDDDKLITNEDEAEFATKPKSSDQGKRITRAFAGRKRAWGGLRDDDIEDDQPQKKAKTQKHKSEGLGSHFQTDIDTMVMKRWEASKEKGVYGVRTGYRKAKVSAAKTSVLFPNKDIAAQKQQVRTTSTKSPARSQIPTTVEIPERPSPKLRIPLLLDTPSDDQVSPTKKPMVKPRIRRAKPPRKRLQETGDVSSAFDLEDDETSELAAADTTMHGSPGSLLSSVDSGFDTSRAVLCPMCDKQVDKSVFEEFKAKHPIMTFHHEQKFCQTHKRASANKEWQDKGYPDIDWTTMDKRIRNHYDFLRTILNGGKSYYANVFSEKIKSGQNKTLLRSEGNLTPGYYGMRGLRLMSEHLVNDLSSELRKRAVQDRLVSARGHMFYVQSVLVPELAVRLIMEDMNQEGTEKVTEEQARIIMKDSVWVGELLNEEVADRVLYEDEEDEESQHDETELREEDEAHIRYEHESKSKHKGEDKPNYGDQGSTDQEDEGVKYTGNAVIHTSNSDKVKSEDQKDAKQEGKDIKSDGNGIDHMKDADDDSSLSDLADSEFEDI